MNNDRLKELRKESGSTQAEFAKKLGVSIYTYRNWEQGRNIPDTSMLVKIADLLNTTVEYLTGRSSIAHYEEDKGVKILKDLYIGLPKEGQNQILSYANYVASSFKNVT